MAEIVLKTTVSETPRSRSRRALRLDRISEALRRWREKRRSRRRLADLDEWLLRDIGLARPEAMREVRKSFPWHRSFPWEQGRTNEFGPWR